MARIQDIDIPHLEFAEAAAPGTPAAGIVRTYAKTDGLLYSKDDAGVETLLSSAAGIPPTIIDAKGDLIAGTAADTAARLAVGVTNGHVLTVDSAEATGLKWAASAAGLTDHTHAATGAGADGGGATLAPTSLTAAGLMKLSAEITSTINADQNNYAPTGIHTLNNVRFTSLTANRTITGLDAGSTGEVCIFVNNTSFSLLLTNESASSTAANRFRTPNAATHTIRQSGAAILLYIASRWTVMAA